MSIDNIELKAPLRAELERAGYGIHINDGDSSWSWQLGDFSSLQLKAAFDCERAAIADALADFVSRVQELVQASKEVLRRWERGDLAEAIRELQMTVEALDVDPSAQEVQATATRPKVHAARAASAAKFDTQKAWLVHGSTEGRAWVEAAFVDHGLAVISALNEALAFRGEGYKVPRSATLAKLRAGEDVFIDDSAEIWLGIQEVGLRRLSMSPGTAKAQPSPRRGRPATKTASAGVTPRA